MKKTPYQVAQLLYLFNTYYIVFLGYFLLFFLVHRTFINKINIKYKVSDKYIK